MKASSQSQDIKSNLTKVVGVLLGLYLSACGTSERSANFSNDGKPNVVTTSTVINDWTQRVGGDEIELTGILSPGADPHVYEPVPKDSIAFEKADLIIYNGYNLEPGLIKMMNAAGVKARKLPVGEVVKPLELDKAGETVPDPHVWGNVKNAIVMVNSIRDTLIELSPEDQAEFTQNAAEFTRQLQQLHTWTRSQVQTIPANKRRLVTTHDAFQYYSKAYGLEVFGTLIGISTEEQPSAQTVRKLADSIRNTGVPAIFAETTINPALIQTVAQESGAKLAPRSLYSDSIGAPGSDGDSYIKMIVANTRTIVEALGGKYTPFEPSSK
ncbi:MAG: metal ABC transporter substrate-binding protein [Chroococcus sp. CMT-3BRIN-NPC107]|jgi:manganese/iron transport system substrate-binding protein|nr:metal ABC transporter substrate-binding protein [Chroococcus sp. CMT-3BRIN-NPC107]